jgi:hypothetical protein
MTQVTIHQITSKDDGDSFLNIDDQKYGHIMAWGNCHQTPTILIRENNSNNFYLYIFDNQEYLNEWLNEGDHSKQIITYIEESY